VKPFARQRDPDDLLLAGARDLGLAIDGTAVGRFAAYREQLLQWASQVNLTALRQPVQMVRDGFLDSLACGPLIPTDTTRVVDVGSGAGFPAIPLAILRPDLRFTLIEATRKKVTFLRHVARSLGLPVEVHHARAEALAQEPAHAGCYDLALARAVAPLPQQARLVRPFLRPGGAFLAQVSGFPQDVEAGLRTAGFRLVCASALPASVDADRRVLVLRAEG
jgi:16S rRNA (guanine527-N7)-methyltransferase